MIGSIYYISCPTKRNVTRLEESRDRVLCHVCDATKWTRRNGRRVQVLKERPQQRNSCRITWLQPNKHLLVKLLHWRVQRTLSRSSLNSLQIRTWSANCLEMTCPSPYWQRAYRILFQRGVYPADDFHMVKKYGQTVLVTQDLALENYLEKYVHLPSFPVYIAAVVTSDVQS